MGAAVLFTDTGGRVLLVEPTYKDYWEVPGGAVDADESPYDAAVREVKEELGCPSHPVGCWWWTGCRHVPTARRV
jgi:8-oxo-dGTP pyrophosphatase MutT (NUDIX family)